MVKLDGGTFRMGFEGGEVDEKPVHDVKVATFSMDATEVTVAAYQACVDGGGCTKPGEGGNCNGAKAERGSHPINCVDWSQATAFCRWANKRLPTEEEWEFAARPKGETFPWGSAEPKDHACWDGEGSDLGKRKRQSTCAVGSHPTGNTATGLKDMAGNVVEWTASQYCSYTASGYDVSTCDDSRVGRGGGWSGERARDMRGAFRAAYAPSSRDGAGMGFRCARSE